MGDIRQTLREAPLLGGFFAAATDLVLWSGDTIVALGLVMIETIDLWIPFLGQLGTLAERVPFLPAGLIDNLLLVAIVLFVIWYGYRIVRSIFSSQTTQT